MKVSKLKLLIKEVIKSVELNETEVKFGPESEDPILTFLEIFNNIPISAGPPPPLKFWKRIVENAKNALFFYEKLKGASLNESEALISDDVLEIFLNNLSKQPTNKVPSFQYWNEIVSDGKMCYSYYLTNKRNKLKRN